MMRLSVTPNEGSLNLLMDTAARAGPNHLDEAWDVLEEMQRRGMRADKYTVSILTKGIHDRGDKRRAPPRGVQLVEHFLKTQSEDVDEVLVNSLLDVFCRMGDMPRLEATLVKMREYGIRGSAVTYGTIVKAYGKAGNIDKVLQAWQEMGRLGLEANAVTYGCMLDACVKCGHLEKALQVFSAMKEGNLHKNMILYATIIKGFAKSKDPLAARKLHKEMVAEGVQCNVVVFNSLIDACVRANDLQGAAEVLQEMTAAGVKPDLITFSTLIKGYCSSGELGKAMRLADELKARDLECDEIVYNSLLEGCVKAGDLQLGLRLFTEMRTHQVRPSSVTFSILVKLLHRAGRLDLACHLVAREMREMHNVTPTRMVWSCLVTCCVKARDLTRAVMVLDLLDREGGATGSARTSMYATVIEGCLTQGEVGIALALCERAYSRVPPEEGLRGILSADLLRRVFEAVGARGPEAEARTLLESISSRLSEQVRASLEDSLTRGARRRSPRGGHRDARNSAPRVGVSEASSIASLGADALLNPTASAAWGGSVVAAAAQQWPPYSPGGYPGMEAPMGNGLGMWDPTQAAAAAAAVTGQWPWPPNAPGMEGYGGMYGYSPEQYYGAGWQWPPTWDDGSNWAAAAGTAAPPMAENGVAPTPQTGEIAAATVADTPKPLQKSAETPSTASGSAGQSTVERTPATTVRSAEEYDADEQEQQTPVNTRLFAGASASDGAGKSTPMRVEVPLSALLDGPPGLK
jgi:pentatricopeptide repeat protein